MSGFFDRIKQAMGGTERTQDPQPADDYAQQTELLQQVRRGAAAVASSRKQIAAQISRSTHEMDSLTVSAHRALESGQDALAREVLARRVALADQLGALETQHDALAREEERLVLTSARVQAKLDAIRSKQQTVWATASASEARQRVDQALAAMSSDLGHAGEAVQSASSRAAASLDALRPPDDLPSVDSASMRVAAELDAMKAELASRAPAEVGQGSYRQPGVVGAKRVQDAQILEPGGPRPMDGEQGDR